MRSSAALGLIVLAVSLFVFGGGVAEAGSLSLENQQADQSHSNGKTALMLAARDADRPRVEILLRQGADVNATNNNGGTPIMYAALGGDIGIVKTFIEKGAHINAVAKNGWSALMIASAKGFVRITGELLQNEADPNLPDVYEWSPLMRAVYEDREAVVRLLSRHPRTDLNHRGENGITALHIATSQGYAHLAVILLEYGADKTIQDNEGRTPYQVAEEKNAVSLLKLLQMN